MNFLESLAAEWYAIQRYFVRTNIKANSRHTSGYDNEIDVLAFLPSRGQARSPGNVLGRTHLGKA
jgi:hypothetical protein